MQQLPFKKIVNRTVDWSDQPLSSSNSTVADLTLKFEFGGQDKVGPVAAMLHVVPGKALTGELTEQTLSIDISPAQLSGAVADCQAAWWKHVIERRRISVSLSRQPYYYYHFHQKSESPVTVSEFNADILPQLTDEGHKLFTVIFRPGGTRYADTKKFGGRLRDVLQQKQDLRILINSEKFLAPWNFLYLGDNNSPPNTENFLGIRHLVEHDLEDAPLVDTEMAAPSRLSIQVDENIDVNDTTRRYGAIASFVKLLADRRIGKKDRNTKAEFLSALKSGAEESIFYFLCHGESGDDVKANFDNTTLYLTQRQSDQKEGITPSDIKASLDRTGPLKGRPLVFINSCRALKTGSIFYFGFASPFLHNDARAVVGSEIEMPVVFAKDFSKRFFEEFFRGGVDRSVGKVLLSLRREYLREHVNPLGLAYSLYRGGTLHLPVGVLP